MKHVAWWFAASFLVAFEGYIGPKFPYLATLVF